jgi:hypothetical protein
MYEWVRQLDDNLRFFGEKSSQFHHELVAKHLKDVDLIKTSTKLMALVIALIELLFRRINELFDGMGLIWSYTIKTKRRLRYVTKSS